MPGARTPYEWVISQVCEEFSCLPSQAAKELENDPYRLAETIMMLRGYANMKDAFDRRVSGQSSEEIPDGALLRDVKHNTERLALERV